MKRWATCIKLASFSPRAPATSAHTWSAARLQYKIEAFYAEVEILSPPNSVCVLEIFSHSKRSMRLLARQCNRAALPTAKCRRQGTAARHTRAGTEDLGRSPSRIFLDTHTEWEIASSFEMLEESQKLMPTWTTAGAQNPSPWQNLAAFDSIVFPAPVEGTRHRACSHGIHKGHEDHSTSLSPIPRMARWAALAGNSSRVLINSREGFFTRPLTLAPSCLPSMVRSLYFI